MRRELVGEPREGRPEQVGALAGVKPDIFAFGLKPVELVDVDPHDLLAVIDPERSILLGPGRLAKFVELGRQLGEPPDRLALLERRMGPVEGLPEAVEADRLAQEIEGARIERALANCG